MHFLTKHSTANNSILKIFATVLFISLPFVGFLLGIQYEVIVRDNLDLATVPLSVQSMRVPENTMKSATSSGTLSPAAHAALKYYDAYLHCVTQPPAQAYGQVTRYCAQHGPATSSALLAHLDAQAVKGYVPVVCASNNPRSATASEELSVVNTRAVVTLQEKFGTATTVNVSYHLLQKDGSWLVDNIICPIR